MLKNNLKVILLYLLAIFLLIGAIAVPYIQKIKFSEETQTRKFRKELSNLEIEVDESLQSIYNLLSLEKFPVSQIPILSIEKLIPAFTSTLIFINDSLVYWSDNSIPVLSKFTENNFGNHVVNISNGWYDIRMHQSGNISIIGIIPIKNNYSYENQFLKNHFSPAFSIFNKVEISEKKGTNEILNIDGDFLFSLDFPDKLILSKRSKSYYCTTLFSCLFLFNCSDI